MARPAQPRSRETTEAMVRNIGRELHEIQQALRRSSGESFADPRLMGILLAHLLICSSELLHNLLMDTARPPRRIQH